MAAISVNLGEAVVAAINANGASFTEEFTARRAYLIQHTPDELEQVRVTLAMGSATMERNDNSRGGVTDVLTFEIAVQQRLGPDADRSRADTLALLTEQIAVFLDDEAITTDSGTYVPTGFAIDGLGGYGSLNAAMETIYSAVITITYRNLNG